MGRFPAADSDCAQADPRSLLPGSRLWFFILFPAAVLHLSGGDLRPPPGPTRWLGVGLIAIAHGLLLRPVRAFIVEGRGTHVPIAPPLRLVQSGFYTRVRNPMYSIYIAIALGEAILFSSTALLAYTAFLCGLAHWYVVTIEEPKLRRRFGERLRPLLCAGRTLATSPAVANLRQRLPDRTRLRVPL